MIPATQRSSRLQRSMDTHVIDDEQGARRPGLEPRGCGGDFGDERAHLSALAGSLGQDGLEGLLDRRLVQGLGRTIAGRRRNAGGGTLERALRGVRGQAFSMSIW